MIASDKKKTKKAEITEDQIQSECFQDFQNNHPQYRGLLFAVPNGGLRDKRTANKLKATGTVAGIPDLVFLYSGKCYGLECKKPGQGLTGKQPEIHRIWNEAGFKTFVFRSMPEFYQIINDIMQINLIEA